MRRLFLSFAVLALSLISVSIVPQHSAAAPLPAAYSGAAGGDSLAFDLDRTTGPDLAGARLAVSQSGAAGGPTPAAKATVHNLAAAVPGLAIAPQSRTQDAPPDHPTADTDTIAPASAPGLLDLGLSNTSVQARTQAAVVCGPGGGELANSQIQSAGATFSPIGVGTIVDTGDSSTTGTVAIVPQPLGDPLNRAVLSTATGTITGTSFLNGAVEVTIDGESTLQARATGVPGGAEVDYDPGTVTVTVAGTTTPLDPGESQTFNVPAGQVVITVNEPTVTEAPNGQTATGTVNVVTAQVRVGPVGAPLATSTVNLLPLRASAVAPPGGIDCPPPPPVLNTPADGSTITDTTPTFTGTALPGADVEIFVDGDLIGSDIANGSGTFSFTPTTPLSPGDHQASARATLNGVTSGPSNVNDFAIDTDAPAAPTLNRPADGEVTRDRTPTFSGRAEPGAEVEIFVDGASIGTTTANGNGIFSFTPTKPLAAGPHKAFVGATDAAGNDSPPSNTNGFRIDTEDPAAPVITSPDDGSTTTDRTPTITGTAEPGSQVIILIDGELVGSTTADENGNFTFTVPDALSLGEHEVSAIAVDEAGNRSDESSPVSFRVLAARADAGPSDQLADTGGPQGWLPVAAAVSVLAGAGILAVARWRRRSSHV